MIIVTWPSASNGRTTEIPSNPSAPSQQREEAYLFRVQQAGRLRFVFEAGVSPAIQPNKVMKSKIRVVSQLHILAAIIAAISLTGAVRAADTASGGGSSLSEKD